jgi:hypothetical protein
MDPAAAAAGAQIVAGVMGQSAQQKANQAQRNMFRKSLRWQQIWSKNKFRLQREDMINAGLNPMLMAGVTPGGTGAPGPVSQEAETAMADKLEPIVSSALQSKVLKAQVENIKSQTNKTNAETKITESHIPAAEANKEIGEGLKDALNSVKNKGASMLDPIFDAVSAQKQKYNEGKAKAKYHQSQAYKDRQKALKKANYKKSFTRGQREYLKAKGGR